MTTTHPPVTRRYSDVEREILVVLVNHIEGFCGPELARRVEATTGAGTLDARELGMLVDLGLVRVTPEPPGTSPELRHFAATRAGRATVRRLAPDWINDTVARTTTRTFGGSLAFEIPASMTTAGKAAADIGTMNENAPGADVATEGDVSPATDGGASERTRTADPFITSVPGDSPTASEGERTGEVAGEFGSGSDDEDPEEPSAGDDGGRSSDEDRPVRKTREQARIEQLKALAARACAERYAAQGEAQYLRSAIELARAELDAGEPAALDAHPGAASADDVLANALDRQPLAAVRDVRRRMTAVTPATDGTEAAG